MTSKRFKRIKLSFPQISEIAIKSTGSWRNNGVTVVLYNVRNPDTDVRRNSYLLFDIAEDGIYLRYIYESYQHILGIDANRSPNYGVNRTLIMDRTDEI